MELVSSPRSCSILSLKLPSHCPLLFRCCCSQLITVPPMPSPGPGQKQRRKVSPSRGSRNGNIGQVSSQGHSLNIRINLLASEAKGGGIPKYSGSTLGEREGGVGEETSLGPRLACRGFPLLTSTLSSRTLPPHSTITPPLKPTHSNIFGEN